MAPLRELGSASSGVREERDFLDAVCDVLAANQRSLPFTIVYLFDEAEARLTCSSGISEGDPAAPSVIALDDPDPLWPVRELEAGRAVLLPLAPQRFRELPTGDWDEAPQHALLLPILQPTQEQPVGFLVAGLNRYSVL